ncbi:regulator of chromosome condensation 1/beta-lactamase-inhibitor protein II [Syncephalastrum racemosum]|uniref:Regulator of chromosome condensation 1/beta-lactamase-inhibitor protein II n=1 Tax=Syncephalastrum racemosum TaxID=13706 RepID=A0A1X2HBT6_SYNRA|nr:regulator of chromosome condensation 1/beta-lactamase-inhibitor protein II [Syncephalastrum racemosum]
MLLLAFGSNGSGQLGIGHEDDVNIPTACLGIPSNVTIRKIEGGGNHAALLTDDGRVFLSGKGQYGDVRLDGTEYTQFREPPELSQAKWKDVACGWSFTILVREDGRVFGFGSARSGELGPSVTKQTSTPLEIDPSLQNIIAVSCGWRHVVALDNEGRVYGWGWGRHGQLKQAPEDKRAIFTPFVIPTDRPIKKIACGHLHTVLLDDQARISVFGSNKFKQLEPDHASVTGAINIYAGWHHSVAHVPVEDSNPRGHFVGWGRRDYHQSIVLSGDLFSCGSEHNLIVQDNILRAYGWNEHGNCTTDKEAVFAQRVSLPPGRITLVSGGCATSWVAISPSSS